MSAAGDLIYGGTSGTGTKLAGNITSTKQFLSSTGTGSAANAPAWAALTAADIPALNASMISSGALAIANGGTGTGSTNANYVFAGPTSGSGAPSFRALVAGDYPAMVGANGTDAGTAGAVPEPTATDNVKFLRGDGTWANPPTTPAGSTNQIQYNSGGALTGNANFVYSGGNVGIGTTAPVARLHVTSTIPATSNLVALRLGSSFSDTSSSQSLAFFAQNDATNYAEIRQGLDSSTSSNLQFFTKGTGLAEKMRITSSGNVGIGTTAPTNMLTVAGKIQSTTGGIVFPDGTTQTSAAINAGTNNSMVSGFPDAIRCNVTNPAWGWRTLYIQESPFANTYYYRSLSSTVEYVIFNPDGTLNAVGNYTSHNCNVSVSSLYANGQAFNFAKGPAGQWLQNGTSAYYNAGNVGIGTTAPQSKLDVYSNGTGLSLEPGNGTTFFGTLGFNREASNGAIMSSGHNAYQFTNFDNRFQLEVYNGGGTAVTYSALAVSSSGNVGIGTTNPQQALQVNGFISTGDAGLKWKVFTGTSGTNSTTFAHGVEWQKIVSVSCSVYQAGIGYVVFGWESNTHFISYNTTNITIMHTWDGYDGQSYRCTLFHIP
jgi:hypothetical protein